MAWIFSHELEWLEDVIPLCADGKPATLVVDSVIGTARSIGSLVLPCNLRVRFEFGGMVLVECSQVLTFEGSVEAGLYQIFGGNPAGGGVESPFPGHAPTYLPPNGHVSFGAGSVEKVIATWFGCRAFRSSSPDGEIQQLNWQPKYNSFALQASIDSAYDVRKVFIPSGRYKIATTLRIGSFNETPFLSCEVFGAGGTNASRGGSTSIEAVFADKPAIDIERVRSVVLRDLAVIGMNEIPPDAFGQSTGKYKREEKDWRLPYVTERHYGICTEAMYAEPPPGHEGPFNPGGSQNVTIENVLIRGFNVGICISPANANQNDTHRIYNCCISDCVRGVSVRTTQARSITVEKSMLNRCFVALDNRHPPVWGETGSSGSKFNSEGNQFTTCLTMYEISTSFGGQCHISGDYAENVGRLGDFGSPGNPTGTAVVFNGCYYYFQGEVARYSTIGSPITFIGCTFIQPGADEPTANDPHPAKAGLSTLYFYPGTTTAQITFHGCKFQQYPLSHFRDDAGGEVTLTAISNAVVPYNYLSALSFHDCIDHNNALGEAGPNKIAVDMSTHLTDFNMARRLDVTLHTQTLRISSHDDKARFYALNHPKTPPTFFAGNADLIYDGRGALIGMRLPEAPSQQISLRVGDWLYAQVYSEWLPNFDKDHNADLPVLQVVSIENGVAEVLMPNSLRDDFTLFVGSLSGYLRLYTRPFVVVPDKNHLGIRARAEANSDELEILSPIGSEELKVLLRPGDFVRANAVDDRRIEMLPEMARIRAFGVTQSGTPCVYLTHAATAPGGECYINNVQLILCN